jgi:hypothetical protein
MTKTYIIDSDIDEINACIKTTSEIVGEFFSNNNEEIKLYSMVLYEVLINAVEHGNLGITYLDKKNWIIEGVYKDKLLSLLESDSVKNKKVYINITMDDNFLTTIVEDEGNGFDPKKQMNEQMKDGVIRENGRGMVLINSYFDDIIFNEKSNKVTLIKNRS